MLSGMNRKLRSLCYLSLAALAAAVAVSPAGAESNYATEQRKNAAMGHYARARTMLVEALAEFEQARKYARPDMLLDPEEWRLSVISRTEELNRVLDPKPRVSRDGVRFQANPILIRREKDRTPPVADGAKQSNYAGEEQRREDLRNSRARMEIPVDKPVKVVPKIEPVNEKAEAEVKAQKVISFDNGPSKAEQALQETQQPPVAVEAAKSITPEVIKEEEEITTNQAVVTETVEQKPSKLIADEEEIEVKPAEQPKTTQALIPDEEDAAANAGAQTLEEKEDEVTREIERAIQERIKKEKAGGPAGAAGTDAEDE